MELMHVHHLGSKMLANLHHALINDFPEINPPAIALACDIESVNWWKPPHTNPMETFIKLFFYLREHHIPDLAVHIARSTQVTDLGMMGYSMLTAATTLEYLLVGIYALDEVSFPTQINLEESNSESALVFSENKNIPASFTIKKEGIIPATYGHYFTEITLAIAWRFAQTSGSHDKIITATHASLIWPESMISQGLIAALGCDIEFEADRNAIYFPSEQLQQRNALGDIDLISQCSVQCSQIIRNTKNRGTMQLRIEKTLLSSPKSCRFSLTKTADTLGISTTKIQRQLKAEGSNFKKIALEIRMNLAKEYLATTSLTIQQIAFQLCYDEANNFIRAFKNFYGSPPGSYRDTLQSEYP